MASEWIPVSERLPEEGKPVMAWNSGGWCLKPWACHVICDYRDGEWREVEERDLYPGVTHWMPLPEPPSLAAPDLTPDTVAALREDWESLHKGPRQHVEIVTLPELPEVK